MLGRAYLQRILDDVDSNGLASDGRIGQFSGTHPSSLRRRDFLHVPAGRRNIARALLRHDFDAVVCGCEMTETAGS